MDKAYKALTIAGVLVMGFAVTTIIMGAKASADADREIAEVDAFLEQYEAHMTEAPKAAHTWQEQQLAKITGFEVGFCCDVCQFYCASACVNRMNDWYDGDPIAMVTDGNDEYYYMNPEYAEYDCIEVNGWNYYQHANEMLKVVKEAEERTADIWYWDCEETQSAWADLVYVCNTDGMYFYR